MDASGKSQPRRDRKPLKRLPFNALEEYTVATYDPVSTATALAENYVYARQTQLDTASSKVQTQVSALNSLKSSLTTFTSALNTLSGKGDVIAQTAKVSSDNVATASAGSSAAAGNYSFTVEQLATSQQTLISLGSETVSKTVIEDGIEKVVAETRGLGLTPAAGETDSYDLPSPPTMALSVGSDGFYTIDLSNADTDNDGKLSATEIARAINAGSEGKVSAAVITQDGKQQLLLNGTSTGQDGAFSVGWGSSKLAFSASTGQNLAEAQNAVFYVGGRDGLKVEQSTNSYQGVSGLSVEFKAVSSTPVTVTVSKDEAKTKSNMQSFVDAYNTMVKAIDKLTAAGNAESGVAAGVLSGDSSIRSLRNKLNSLLRSSVGGVSLTDFGISAQRDGTIALDGDRFAKKVAANPEALTTLLGQTNTLEYKRSGVLGNLQTYVESWTKSTGGLLQSRQDSLQKQQLQFDKQQSSIDRMYEQAYQRYLTQFSVLAGLEDQMSSTTNMLSSMFASSNKTS